MILLNSRFSDMSPLIPKFYLGMFLFFAKIPRNFISR